MANRRLLISFAHPDDESFGLGALIGKYVAEGVDVYYICATNGDVGTVSPELLNGYNSVAELRLAELDCASALLGFKKVYKFGYKDSGMMKSEFNDDPTCLWQAPLEDVTRKVVEVIREIQPQVIVTFNRYGGYGHPDHIAIQRATLEAFTLSGQSDYVTGQQPYAPQKLYYNNFPTIFLKMMLGLMRLRGEDPRKAGRNKDLDFQAVLDYVEPTHAMVNIAQYYDIWDRASACHVSQGGGGAMSRMQRVRRLLFRKQGFTRVYPKPVHDRIDEYDLFAGVRVDEPIPAQ